MSAPERALENSEKSDAATGEAVAPHKKNCCGAEKRARRNREKALTGPKSLASPRLSRQRLRKERRARWQKRPAELHRYPLSMHETIKESRAQKTGFYATVAYLLARAITLGDYPEQAVTPEQLALLRGVVDNKPAGIREGFLPRFTEQRH